MNTSERTLNSVFRRTLVIELRGEFVTAEQLRQRFPNGDNESAGVFLKDPSLKAFLTDTTASAALLRILEGFMLEFSATSCTDVIEEYVTGGGDKGLTLAVVRHACGLKAIVHRTGPEAEGVPPATHDLQPPHQV